MSGFLLDTSIVSELAPDRKADSRLARWLRLHRKDVFLPAICVIEIERGIARLRRLDGARRAESLSQWLDTLLTAFSERVLAVDVPIARLAGRMSDEARAIGRDPGLADVMIAATAAEHRLTIATRNLRHFEPLRVPCLDPLAAP